ncbi:hypothetical protein D9756_009704 [Leucocoprinus leucothites]|uniref:Uncharacterized protein n=1 Tax=Leucocoprinus leucothites TaxID=201217 RepID=A0A8H5FU68_9AGAR|nr:hypothetical protein D9756_009704 [Leucoagaricus leucothites]
MIATLMGRWTQYEEDAARLPEGMKRIGYDADTQCYTFQDRYTGALYRSEPGNVYGTLTPVNPSESNARTVRPNAFASTDPAKQRSKSTVNTSISSFDDFLPSSAITAPPPPPSKVSLRSPISDSPTNSRLPGIFRKVRVMSSAVSRMQPPQSEGPPGHIKSPSLPISSSSKYRDSPSPPPLPTRRMRGYTRLPDPRQEEDKKALLRSKTMSSASSSRSAHAPTRSSSRASRASAVSTTSTITPMKTR